MELLSKLGAGVTTNRRIFWATASVALASLAVLAVSTIKELAVAQWFGRQDALDAFLIAYVLPAFVVNIAGGSFSSAVVPTFIEVRSAEGSQAAQRLFSGVLVWSLMLLAGLAVLLGVFAPYYLPLLGSGFSAAKLALTRQLLYTLLPFVVLSGVAATCTAILNAGERFALPALAPGLVPLGAVVFLWTLGRAWGIMALAAGTVVGAMIQAAILVWMLRARSMKLGLGWYPLDSALRRVAGQYAPMAAGALLMGTTDLVDQAMAAMLPPGSVAALNYARKIVSVSIVLGAVPLSTAALPYFSEMTANRDWAGCRHTLKTYSRLIVAITVPITAVLVLFPRPLVGILFERGAFSVPDTAVVSHVEAWLALQIPFYLLCSLGVRLISALKRNAVLMTISAVNTMLNVALNWVLMKHYGVAGIALSTSIVYCVACALVFASIGAMMKRMETKGTGDGDGRL
ncbi:MAG TPA: lipid II flippase MurJ [Terriglobia bacterium]|nr:lipid II flippase MurJ [Terriglobia bacterium]